MRQRVEVLQTADAHAPDPRPMAGLPPFASNPARLPGPIRCSIHLWSFLAIRGGRVALPVTLKLTAALRGLLMRESSIQPPPEWFKGCRLTELSRPRAYGRVREGSQRSRRMAGAVRGAVAERAFEHVAA